jgi:hypothetical protein
MHTECYVISSNFCQPHFGDYKEAVKRKEDGYETHDMYGSILLGLRSDDIDNPYRLRQ